MFYLILDITYNDLVNVHPFENTLDIAELQGKYLWQSLEYAADRFSNERVVSKLNLLQVSGIIYYNPD